MMVMVVQVQAVEWEQGLLMTLTADGIRFRSTHDLILSSAQPS